MRKVMNNAEKFAAGIEFGCSTHQSESTTTPKRIPTPTDEQLPTLGEWKKTEHPIGALGNGYVGNRKKFHRRKRKKKHTNRGHRPMVVIAKPIKRSHWADAKIELDRLINKDN